MVKKKKKEKKHRQAGKKTFLIDNELHGAISYLHSYYGDDNDPGKLEDGPRTQKLKEKLSKEELSDLLLLYKTISIFKNPSGPKCNYPKNEVKKIEQVLEKLESKKWIEEYGAASIVEYIKAHMSYSIKGSEYIAEYLLKKNVKTGGRPLNEPALVFLIINLMSLLNKKRISSPRKYELVADFLTEQEIVDFISSDAIKKAYKRNKINSKKIKKILRRIQEIISLMYNLQFRSRPRRLSLPKKEQVKPPDIPDIKKIIKIFDRV